MINNPHFHEIINSFFFISVFLQLSYQGSLGKRRGDKFQGASCSVYMRM